MNTLKIDVNDKSVKDFLKLIKTLDTSVNKLGRVIDDVFDIDSKKMKEASNSLKEVEKTQKDLDNGASRRNQNQKRTNDVQKKYNDTLEDSSKKLDDNTKKTNIYQKTIGNFTGSVSGLTRKVESFIPFGLGFHFSISKIVREAHQANIETIGWSRELARLSDSSGGTTKAIGQMHEIFAVSSGSLATVRANMKGLVDQGIPASTKGFKGMVAWVTNLSDATGIGADAFNSFTGVMVRQWQVSMGANKRMMSSVLALQDAFGMTAGEIEMTMKTTGDAMGKMASYFKDGEKSAMALTKGIAQTVGVLSKLGVSAQKANEFVSGLLDMDKFSENIVLFSRLGISYQETMDMMSSANAKELVFDKLMTNLPKVAQQIQGITNPMARMNFAKSIGLPLEIAQKMAGKTTGEIREMMDEYKKKAVSDKAAQKKQEQMKADAAKFEDTLHIMKRDALLPMMQWLNANMKYFWQGAKFFFGVFKKYTKGLSNVFEGIKKSFLPAFDVLTSGGGFGDFLVALSNGILDIGQKILKKALDIVVETGPRIASGLFDAWTKLMAKHPVLTSLITVATGIKAASGAMKTFKNIKEAFFKARGATPATPLFVSDVGVGKILGKGIFGAGGRMLQAGRGALRGDQGIIGALTAMGKGGSRALAQGGIASRGLLKAGQFASKGIGKIGEKLLGAGGKRIPIIGALLSAGLGAKAGYDMADTTFKNQNGGAEATGTQKAVSTTVGGMISGGGALGGAAAGAAFGSVVPIVGTAIGAIVGGLAGGFAGDLINKHAGPAITKAIYNFGDSFTKLNKTELKKFDKLSEQIRKGKKLDIKQQEEYNLLYKRSLNNLKENYKPKNNLGDYNQARNKYLRNKKNRSLDDEVEMVNNLYKSNRYTKDKTFKFNDKAKGATSNADFYALRRAMSDNEKSQFKSMKRRWIAGDKFSKKEEEQFKVLRKKKLYYDNKYSTKEEDIKRQKLEYVLSQDRFLSKEKKEQYEKELIELQNKNIKVLKIEDRQRAKTIQNELKKNKKLSISRKEQLKEELAALAKKGEASKKMGALVRWWVNDDSPKKLAENIRSYKLFWTGISMGLNTAMLHIKDAFSIFFKYGEEKRAIAEKESLETKIKMAVAKKEGWDWTSLGTRIKLLIHYGTKSYEQMADIGDKSGKLGRAYRKAKLQKVAGSKETDKQMKTVLGVDYSRSKLQSLKTVEAVKNYMEGKIKTVEKQKGIANDSSVQHRIKILKDAQQTQIEYLKNISNATKDKNLDDKRNAKIQNKILDGISNYTKQTAEKLNEQSNKRLQGQDLINSLIGMQRSLKLSQNMTVK